MLFDLRGRGRRNTIKMIYIFLAFLMGIGLVGFGIGGGANSNGGLLDALTGGGGSSNSGQKRFEKQVQDAQVKTAQNPQDEAAYVQLIRARVQLAGSGDRYDANSDKYNADGVAELKRAAADWDKYEALKPKNTEEQSRLASLMVRAFISLNQIDKAAGAQEVVATSRDTYGAYAQWATYAYAAGENVIGDRAAKKAVDLAPSDMRTSIKAQLDSAKQSALQQQVQQAVPSPTATVG